MVTPPGRFCLGDLYYPWTEQCVAHCVRGSFWFSPHTPSCAGDLGWYGVDADAGGHGARCPVSTVAAVADPAAGVGLRLPAVAGALNCPGGASEFGAGAGRCREADSLGHLSGGLVSIHQSQGLVDVYLGDRQLHPARRAVLVVGGAAGGHLLPDLPENLSAVGPVWLPGGSLAAYPTGLAAL